MIFVTKWIKRLKHEIKQEIYEELYKDLYNTTLDEEYEAVARDLFEQLTYRIDKRIYP